RPTTGTDYWQPEYVGSSNLPEIDQGLCSELMATLTGRGTGAGATGDVHSRGLRPGCGSTGRLVRGNGRDWRRARCMACRCGRWPAAPRFVWLITTPRSSISGSPRDGL